MFSIKSKLKSISIFVYIGLFFIVFFSFAEYTREKYIRIYNEGVELLETGDAIAAIEVFKDIPDFMKYRDIAELLKTYDVSICPNCGALLELEIE